MKRYSTESLRIEMRNRRAAEYIFESQCKRETNRLTAIVRVSFCAIVALQLICIYWGLTS